MVLDIKMLREQKEESRRKDPSNYKQKAVRWMRIHPKVSILTGTLFLGALAYSILPLGFLFFLPDYIVKHIIYMIVGGIPGFYSGRALYRRFGRPPTEKVYKLNIADSPMIEPYWTMRGSFEQKFEFKNHKPVKEQSSDGTPIYTVLNIDHDQKVAYGPHWGDIPQAKLIESKEAIEAQFMYNDELRKFGAEMNLKFDQIVSQIEYQYANAFLRKLETVVRPEDISEASREGVPGVDVDLETPDLDEMMKKADVQNPRGLEPENQIDQGSQE